MHHDGERYVLGEPKFLIGKPLYGIELLGSHLDEAVVVCEGEHCADHLRKCGILAITSGGAQSADCADWSPIAGRNVLIWPDHDAPGFDYANAVTARIGELGCTVALINTEALRMGDGEDAVDWLRRNPDACKEDILGLAQECDDVPIDDQFAASSGVPFIEPGGAGAGLCTPAERTVIHCAHFCAHRTSKSFIIWGVRIANGREEERDKPHKR
jgi:hypothetical protein